MGSNLKEELCEALGCRVGDEACEAEAVKSALMSSLLSEGRAVMDAASGGNGRKAKGERPDGCKAIDPTKCWKHGFGADVLNAQRKEYARKMDRVNPAPTKDIDRELSLERDIRELSWDLDDTPDSKADTEYMIADLDALRREAGMKKLDESFKPFAEYRGKWKEYMDFKKEASQAVKAAKASLRQRRYDDVDRIMSAAEKLPAEMSKKYQGILDSYDRLCDALCEILDERGDGEGAKNPAEQEAAKSGFGAMDGESGKSYKKRMKSLGRGKDIPKTIEKIDEIVAQTERRWRSIAGISKEEFDTVKKNFRKTFGNLMKRCSLATNRGIMGVNGVLEEHLKSQHEMVRKGERFSTDNTAHHAIIGGNEHDPRYSFTRKCFGTASGSLKPNEYEKYGCLHMLNPTKDDNLTGGQYGKNVIRWKPHKVLATMTFTDSLCLAREGLNYVNPCLVSDPSPCCFNPENQEMVDTFKKKAVNIGLDAMCSWTGSPYIELQLHGEDNYDADAIESISFGSDADVANLSPKALTAILERKIPCYIGAKPINMAKLAGGKRNADTI